MNKQSKLKLLLVVLLSISFMFIEVLISRLEHSHIAFTSLFFIPLILMGIWIYQLVIPLSILFSIFVILTDFFNDGNITIDAFFRCLIMIVGSAVIYYLSREINKKNKEIISINSKLEIENELFSFTIMSIGDGVISTDISGRIVQINKIAQQLTGWEGTSAVGQPFNKVFNIVNEITLEKCDDPISKVLETGQIAYLENYTRLVSKDGSEYSIEDSASPIRDVSDTIHGVVFVFRDVTNDRSKIKQIEFLSFRDQLTGLGNRRYWDEQLAYLDQEKFLPLSIIMGDVNGLKLTNDTFGHAEGDELLRQVANELKSVCRSTDIICRYGGDEFTILLPNTEAKISETIVDRLRFAISKRKLNSINLSMALGWAVKIKSDENINDIVKEAENYLYKRKQFESPSTRGNIVKSIMHTLNENSERERLHSERAGFWCDQIAKTFNLEGVDIEKYKIACELHDIGKIAIDQKILDKTEKLTIEEWAIVKQHPEVGYRILKAIPEYFEVAQFVLAHHERWDGKGYPYGLKGNDIPYISRIITIVDSYDAMISQRTYRKALSDEKAIQELIACSGTQFDPELVKLFVEKVLKKDNYLF